jgi:hypothetical protein
MYSSSNSFLGGANSARPGPGQFGPSQSFSNYQQPPPPQQSSFAPQPTGYGGGSLQPQFAGYPGPGQQAGLQAPQQQPQPTGFQFQGQQPQQTPFPQPQQQSVQPPQQQQQAVPALLRPQQTSAQIAQSFQSTPSAPAAPPQATKSSTKIPNIRLSFITVTDQAKFEQLFKSAVGDSQALDGRKTVAIPHFCILTPHRRESQRSSVTLETAGQCIVADMVSLPCAGGLKLELIIQDSFRHNEVWTAPVSRICSSHVSLQSQVDRPRDSGDPARKNQE